MLQSPRKKPLAAMACLTFSVTAPFAAQAATGLYVGAEAGANFVPATDMRIGDSALFNSKLDTGYVLGVNTGYAFDNGLRPEFAIDFRNNGYHSVLDETGAFGGASDSAGGREEATSYMLNLWYDFKQPTGLFSTVHPYIGGGVGGNYVKISHLSSASVGELAADGRNTFGYQGGAGIGYDLNRNLTISADYRYLQSNRGSYSLSPAVGTATGEGVGSSRYRAQSIMVGLRYFFAAPAPAVAAAAPLAVAPVAALPPPPPPPPPVIDSDGDGVPDNLDKCPNTPKGFKVDANGCIIQQTLVLQAVNFQTNSDQLTEAAKQSLDPIVAALQSQPSLRVEIDGHTDSRGSAKYNLQLSDKRAKSVRAYLISKGIDGGRLDAKGFGATKPIASNDTEAGRTENRRVEFVVLGGTAPDTNVTTEGSTAASKAAASEGKPAKSKKK